MLPRERYVVVVTALLCLARLTHQYSSGAPPVACLDQIPRHSDILPQTTVPPYGLFPSTSQVRQGDTLNVTIAGSFGAPLPIGGFILQAREIQDTEKIVGKFTSIPDVVATRIINCRGENDTVTHANPEEKPPLTFVWQAPQDFLGGIEFRATVAQGYATFWKNIESPLVEVVSPDTVITTRAPATTTTRDTPAPPVIMESKPKTTPPPLDTIYQGCADTKLCFGVPENCATTGTCKAIVAVFVAGDEYTFEIQGSGNPKYIAAGLSMDNKMGDDSAMECVRNDNGRVSLFTSWTYAKEEPYVRRSDSPQDIVQLQESSMIDGKLYCKFKRNIVSVVKGQTFDLANNKYNLMVVSGESMKDENRVGFHSLVYESTGSPVALASVGNAGGASKLLLKLHGSFMVAAWIGSASLGILLARYFRKTWVGKTLGGKDIWFAYHRILMVITWLLTMAGFVVILIEVGGYSTTGDNPHAITGLVTVILCFLQPIGAFFRPHPGTKTRPIFNWLHWLAGNAAHILGIATIFLAVYLQKAELPAWTVFLLAAFVAFHVILHLILSLAGCVSEGRVAGARVDAFPLKDMLPRSAVSPRPEHGADAPFSKFRKHLLGVYAPIIVLFAAALVCLVALAPIGVTYNSLMGS
ncbi:putative ferric-chelate reductase 1 homolog [Aricia agestis]|uniref:putative ferric-chelate reductase 1 homolog n=1 Tax=Aricia agestis TaxID=91739 RepID=UPI001C20ACB6|nr:putative ferric-chelate reductase 1 homolog [Aricia agestis]XP_041972012.1 putative ferric-chelate reductase 1 homolog [Aricia agestis]